MTFYLPQVFPISTLFIIGIEIFLCCFAFLLYALDRDKSNLRFIILTLLFLQYNVVNGFLPNWNYNWFGDIYWSILFQNILAYSSGIILAVYYFYFLTEELDIKPTKRFNVKFLLVSLFISFLLFYVLIFIFTWDKDTARLAFIPFPSLIALYFACTTVIFIWKNRMKQDENLYQKSRSFSGYTGIMFMATMPLILWWGDDNKGWNHLLVNASYFLSFYAHLLQFIKHNKRFAPKDKLSQAQQKYQQLKMELTKKQIEVLSMVAQGKTNKEIATLMFISEATVRSHLRDIYKKASVNSMDSLLTTYPDLSIYFYE